MFSRRGRLNVNIVSGAIFLGLVALVGGGALFGPYYWDYLTVKEITRSTALTYLETEIFQKAEQELQQQVQQRELPDYFDPNTMCTLNEDRKKLFVVRCEWTAYVYYPFTDYYKALHFTVTSETDAQGQVTTY